MNPPSIYLHQVHYRTFTLAHRAAGVRLSDLTPAHIHDGVLVIKPSFRQRRLVTYDAARTLFQRGRIGPQDMLSNRLFNPHTGRFIQWSARNVRRVHQQHRNNLVNLLVNSHLNHSHLEQRRLRHMPPF